MLRRLALTNFRSYKTFEIGFDSPLVAIIGPNASGKTNLLESIFVASMTKSFRAHDNQLINFEEQFYKVICDYDTRQVELRFVIDQNHHYKTVYLDQVKRPASQLLGVNPVTLFEPNDLGLFHDTPSVRRRYLDLVLSQIDNGYLHALALYRRALKQRNSLLFQAKRSSGTPNLTDHLFVWDVQLSGPAKTIIAKRHKFLDSLSQPISMYYQQIAQDNSDFSLDYKPSLELVGDDVMDQLQRNHPKDIAAGVSTLGPHRDDFVLTRDNRAIMEIISRGETRTAVLSLKLAEMDFIEQSNGTRPILLLDDVFSELDEMRRKFLLKTIANQQTFLTTTELSDTKLPAQIIDLSGVA